MDEESVTITLKKSLLEHGFYVKKLADRTTQGIPDTFLCKNKRGMFVEIKYMELVRYPKTFQNWGKLKPSGKLVQLTTMVQFDSHFLARYFFIFNIKDRGVFYCRFMPAILLDHMQRDESVVLPELVKLEVFIGQIKMLLQVT